MGLWDKVLSSDMIQTFQTGGNIYLGSWKLAGMRHAWVEEDSLLWCHKTYDLAKCCAVYLNFLCVFDFNDMPYLACILNSHIFFFDLKEMFSYLTEPNSH